MNEFFLIGVFIEKEKILSFLGFLKNKFKLNTEKVYVYNVEGKEKEYLVTFSVKDKVKFLKGVYGSTIVHTKNKSIFSINALNKLIDTLNVDKTIPNDKFEIDWEEYGNKLIIISNGELFIGNLEKIEDKSIFFN
jgi:hypothetical protein